MAYTPFNSSAPTTGGSPTPTRQATIDAIRTNLMALRDVLAAGGFVQGFDYSWSGGTVDEPTNIFYKRGVEWIKVVLTWGTTGGEDGNITKMAFYYSSNSGVGYDNMADDAGEFVLTISYDANGYVNSTSWGSTP